LKSGHRGLPRKLSLAKLLARERGVRNRASVPRLSRKRILAWADAHKRRTGSWPTKQPVSIPEAPDETWAAVEAALRDGRRGLRAGSSLARLLSEHRGRRNRKNLPRLSNKKILAWADAHQRRTGRWPTVNAGPVEDAAGETWAALDDALRQGHRGLPGGSSLRQLLVRKRGLRDPRRLPRLTEEQILEYADRHFERTQRWPHHKSGPLAEANGETWAAINWALRHGRRGLPGGSSLAKLLARRRSVYRGPTGNACKET